MGDLLMKGSWMQRPASCVCRGAVSECMNTIEARAHSIDFSELACTITCSLRDCCPTGRCICRRAAPRIHEGDEGRALQVGPHMPSRLTAQKRARLYAGLGSKAGSHDEFTSRNYLLSTTPAREWSYVVDRVPCRLQDMRHGRRIPDLDELMELKACF